MAALTTDQKRLNSIKNVPMWVNILKTNNVPDRVIPLIISQIIFETGWFNSTAYKKDNNPAGVTWNENYKSRTGTSIGSKRPAREGGNYVKFVDYNTAAKDIIRILSKKASTNNIGKPIEAVDALDFARRLKDNNYYTSKLIDYANGIKSINNRIEDWTNLTALLKKKSNINLASINPLFILLIIGFLFVKK
jgi:flagellum-specific peptidoglycan hydrolase FlgJ